MVSTSSSFIFSLVEKGMFEQVKFSAITLLLMFLMAKVASSGISSLSMTYSFTIERRSAIAAVNSRSRFSGIISSDDSTSPIR